MAQLLAAEKMGAVAIGAANVAWSVALALLAAGTALDESERVQSMAALLAAATSTEGAVRDTDLGIEAARAAGDLVMASRLENLRRVLGDLRRVLENSPLKEGFTMKNLEETVHQGVKEVVRRPLWDMLDELEHYIKERDPRAKALLPTKDEFPTAELREETKEELRRLMQELYNNKRRDELRKREAEKEEANLARPGVLSAAATGAATTSDALLGNYESSNTRASRYGGDGGPPLLGSSEAGASFGSGVLLAAGVAGGLGLMALASAALAIRSRRRRRGGRLALRQGSPST